MCVCVYVCMYVCINDYFRKMLSIQYNFIDLRRRNSLVVMLRDRDANWKDGCLKGRVEEMTFQTTLKTLNESTGNENATETLLRRPT